MSTPRAEHPAPTAADLKAHHQDLAQAHQARADADTAYKRATAVLADRVRAAYAAGMREVDIARYAPRRSVRVWLGLDSWNPKPRPPG